MSKSPHAEYRQEIGRQYANKHHLALGDREPIDLLPDLYKTSHAAIRKEVDGMRVDTLAGIIEAAPTALEGTWLFGARYDQAHLETLDRYSTNGHTVLKLLAHSALVGAIFDHLIETKYRWELGQMLNHGWWNKLTEYYAARPFPADTRHAIIIALSKRDEAGAMGRLIRAGMGLTDDEMRLANEFGGEKVRSLIDALAVDE